MSLVPYNPGQLVVSTPKRNFNQITQPSPLQLAIDVSRADYTGATLEAAKIIANWGYKLSKAGYRAYKKRRMTRNSVIAFDSQPHHTAQTSQGVAPQFPGTDDIVSHGTLYVRPFTWPIPNLNTNAAGPRERQGNDIFVKGIRIDREFWAGSLPASGPITLHYMVLQDKDNDRDPGTRKASVQRGFFRCHDDPLNKEFDFVESATTWNPRCHYNTYNKEGDYRLLYSTKVDMMSNSSGQIDQNRNSYCKIMKYLALNKLMHFKSETDLEPSYPIFEVYYISTPLNRFYVSTAAAPLGLLTTYSHNCTVSNTDSAYLHQVTRENTKEIKELKQMRYFRAKYNPALKTSTNPYKYKPYYKTYTRNFGAYKASWKQLAQKP